MLAFCGFFTLLLLTIAITKRIIPVYSATAIIPLAAGLLFGIKPLELLYAAADGMQSSFSGMATLFSSIFFFSVIIKNGFFERAVFVISPLFSRGPVLLMCGTVLITIFVAACGSVDGAYIVSIMTMLPLYRKKGIPACILGLLVATATTIGRGLPWSGRVILLSSVVGVDANQLWDRGYGLMILGLAGCAVMIAYSIIWLNRHPAEKRDGVEPEEPKRGGIMFYVNGLLLFSCCISAFFVDVPRYMIFFISGIIAYSLNCRNLAVRKETLSYAGALAAPLCLMQLGIGIMMGVFNNCGVLNAMLEAVTSVLPVEIYRYFPVILSAFTTVLLLVMPFQCVFAVLPIAAGLCIMAGGDPIMAALPFMILYPLGYSPMRTANTVIDDLLGQPRDMHFRFTRIPIASMHIAILIFAVLLNIF